MCCSFTGAETRVMLENWDDFVDLATGEPLDKEKGFNKDELARRQER